MPVCQKKMAPWAVQASFVMKRLVEKNYAHWNVHLSKEGPKMCVLFIIIACV